MSPAPPPTPLRFSRGPAPSPSPRAPEPPFRSARSRAAARAPPRAARRPRPQPPSSGAAAPRSRLLLRRFAWGGLAHQRGGPTAGGGGSECALARGGGWMGWGGGGVLIVYGPEWVWGRPDCVCVYELCGACTLQSPWGPLRCPLPWGQGCSVVPSSFNTQASKSELHPDTHLWSRVNEADSQVPSKKKKRKVSVIDSCSHKAWSRVGLVNLYGPFKA